MSSFWRVCAAIAFAIAIASSRPSSAIASAPVAKLAHLRARRACGSANDGSAPGSRRPPRTPRWSSPSQAVERGHRRSRRAADPGSSRSRAAPSASAARARARSCRGRSPRVSAWTPPPSLSERQKRTRKWSCTSPTALQAEQVLELVEHEQRARAGREADDHRVRDVAREVAEPEQRDAELDRADQEREQDRGLDLRVLARPRPRSRSAPRSRSRWSGR